MKKLIAIILVLMILLAIPGMAMAQSVNPGWTRHETRVRIMKHEADKLVGQRYVLGNNRDGAAFVSHLLIKAVVMEKSLSGKSLYNRTTECKAQDGALAFKMAKNGAITRVAFLYSGMEFYSNSSGRVVRENFHKEHWDYIGMFNGV